MAARRRAVQKSPPIEGLGDLLDLSPFDQLPVTAHHRSLDVCDRMLAVEERDDVEQRPVQEDDRPGVPGRIAQGHARLAFMLDGKGLDPAQAGRGLDHTWRKFRAETT